MTIKRKAPTTKTFGKKAKRANVVPRSLALSQVKFQRSFNQGIWQPGTASTNDFWRYYSYSLATIPNFTEFTSVFDMYKIDRIKVTFNPRYDNFSGNDTLDSTLPGVTNQTGCYLHVVNDPTSQLPPSGTYSRANFNLFAEQGNLKTYQALKPVSVSFTPKIYTTVGADSVGKMIPSGWLSTNSININHFGFHIFAQDYNFNGSFGQAFDVVVTYDIQFKGMR